jgi:hypothetical protein
LWPRFSKVLVGERIARCGSKSGGGKGVLVQALDGLFYKDVIIYGNSGTIDFSSHIGRVIVPCRSGSSELAGRAKANKLIRELGVTGRLLERSDEGIFIVNGVAVPGMAFDFLLLGPLAAPGSMFLSVMEPREHEEVFGFFSDFYVSDLVDCLNGGSRLVLLDRALLGMWASNTALVKRRLFAQHPGLRGIRKLDDTATKLRVSWCVLKRKVECGEDSFY